MSADERLSVVLEEGQDVYDIGYVDKLVEENDFLEAENKKLTEGKISELLIDDRYGVYEIEYVKRLRGALKFYANSEWADGYPGGVFCDKEHTCLDFGETARKALEK